MNINFTMKWPSIAHYYSGSMEVVRVDLIRQEVLFTHITVKFRVQMKQSAGRVNTNCLLDKCQE